MSLKCRLVHPGYGLVPSKWHTAKLAFLSFRLVHPTIELAPSEQYAVRIVDTLSLCAVGLERVGLQAGASTF